MPQISSKIIANLNGKDIILFKIQNGLGAYVEIMNYGATLISFVVPDRQGDMRNIILRYDNIDDYFSDTSYIGSTIGRFANRISNAQFTLKGKTYLLDKNDGNNSNHGGFTGFSSRIFDHEICENTLILSYKSIDGEGGFPGNLDFRVSYSFSDENKLCIGYKPISDNETVFNPTNHAYFNLSTEKESILNHKLQVLADSYLETNDDFIPTGEILSIKNTAFDFSTYKTIAEMMLQKKEIIQGFNTYFVSNSKEELKYLASLQDENSNTVLDVYSTMPGVQIYTGDYLSGQHKSFSGICLEAQFYPDGPNHAHFETCWLKPFEIKAHEISFHYSVK